MLLSNASDRNWLKADIVEKLIFAGLVVILLVQILANKHYLTLDGPSHLYNARVVTDMLAGRHLELYERFYEINTAIEPNWFSHIVLGGLLTFFKPMLAEKIFLSAYVIAFAMGIRTLIRAVNKENTFLSILALPLMFVISFQMGFYNYSWSFVLYFFTVAFWIKHVESPVIQSYAGLVLLSSLLYFTHPIGFLTTGLTVAALTLSRVISTYRLSHKIDSRTLAFSIIGFLPGIIMFGMYLGRKGLNPTPNPDNFDRLFQDIIELRSLIVLSGDETVWALLISIVFGALIVFGVKQKLRFKSFQVNDAFFIVFVLMLIIYFVQPGGVAGAGILSVRIQFIPHLVVLPWLATLSYGKVYKLLIPFAVIIVGMALTLTRLPVLARASDNVEEYLSVSKYIDAGSSLLPLNFMHNDITQDGNHLTSSAWLFVHAADYLGLEKPLVILTNYEANTGNFPLIWRWDANPFKHMGPDGSLESQPPAPNLEAYERHSGQMIDYVITWCLTDNQLSDPRVKLMMDDLKRDYVLIFTSENGLAMLYKRKQ